MSVDVLNNKIDGFSTQLKDVVQLLHASSSRLATSTRERIEVCESLSNQLLAVKKVLGTRIACVDTLNDLLANSDNRSNTYKVNELEFPFHIIRLMYFQGLLSTTWSAYDALTTVAGKLLCTGKVASNPKQSPQLWQNFTKSSDAFSSYQQKIIRREYGYPIALSYAIRNHLIHDCGQTNGNDFFEGISTSDAFVISDEGWLFIDNKVTGSKDYAVANDRGRLALPVRKDNLLTLLEACHHEIDNAIIILLSSSVNSVGFFVKSLLEV